MISKELLYAVIIVEVSLLTVMFTLILLHALVLSGRARWIDPRIAHARHEIVKALSSAAPASEPLDATRRLSLYVRIHLFLELAPSLAGRQREILGELADRLGLLQRAVRLSRSRLETRRLFGARLLTGLGDDPVMLDLFHDRSAVVRSQAAEWALYYPEGDALDRLVRLLADDSALCRFTAQDTLLRLGQAAVDPLVAFLGGDHPPAALEAGLKVAIGLADPRFLPVSLRLTHSSDAGVRHLATSLLARVGGAAAAATLVQLLDDDAPDTRAAAAAGLGRLGHWRAGPRVARLLREPSWDVRYAAGAALMRMGGPGELLLRRAVNDDDAFAADMARHILALPAVLAPGTQP